MQQPKLITIAGQLLDAKPPPRHRAASLRRPRVVTPVRLIHPVQVHHARPQITQGSGRLEGRGRVAPPHRPHGVCKLGGAAAHARGEAAGQVLLW
jgi:hypothetical protein